MKAGNPNASSTTPSTSAQALDPSPIAILGIGCRFAGGIEGPESFWRALIDGLDLVQDEAPERFPAASFFDAEGSTAGTLYSTSGGFLDTIDGFDAAFFELSPREAEALDPQQRLLLQVAWEAMEDAGLRLDVLRGRRAGVFVGQCYRDYSELFFHLAKPAGLDLYANVGGAPSLSAGRISFALGLEGPSLTIDTACSSSLIAVHLACQSLRSGESEVAFAAGANLLLRPEYSLGFAQANMLSPDGRCKFGDASANGFVRSEGVGVVVLKPLARALEDGDPIYAVIRGSASNNDGRSGPEIMTPSAAGQSQVLHQAYRDAGLSPQDVGYIEAHGTGTSVGDPIEMRALGTVLGPREQPCRVGSVKSNLGHTEGAAGIAGLIKATLCLERETLPASLHCQTPNPSIPWDEHGLEVVQETTPWPRGERRIAGVSSFGISGSNCHLVLEDAPSPSVASVETSPADSEGAPWPDHAVLLSARSEDSLAQRAKRTLARAEATAAPELADLAYTTGCRLGHHEHRLAVLARDAEGLRAELTTHTSREPSEGVVQGRRLSAEPAEVVFVFPGQGSQWLGMGRQLWKQEPVFRSAFDACARAIDPLLVDGSLHAQLEADEETSQLHRVDIVQPMLFALQVSLAALWRSRGVEPTRVVGHSMGEVAAAHVAGALDLDDAARVICRRSQLVAEHASRQGGMAFVELDAAEAERRLAAFDGRLAVAAINSPRSLLLSGETEALDQILATLTEEGVFNRRVEVDYASHSPQMDALREPLLEALDGLRPRAGTIPILSTVEARAVDGSGFDAAYWADNLRQTVRLEPVLSALLADGPAHLVEVSPHPVLQTSLREIVADKRSTASVHLTLRRHEDETRRFTRSLAELWVAGGPVDWGTVHPTPRRSLRLPTYPWDEQRYWYPLLDEPRGRGARGSTAGGTDQPLLHTRFDSSAADGAAFWQSQIGIETYPYLRHHQVQGSVLLPGAFMAEMALEALRDLGPDTAASHALSRIQLEEALYLPDTAPVTTQLRVQRASDGRPLGFALSSRSGDDGGAAADGTAGPWTLHARGTVVALDPEADGTVESLDVVRQRCPGSRSATDHYRLLTARGLEYGATFQGVQEIALGDDEAVGRLELRDPSTRQGYAIHPALFDAGLQVAAALSMVFEESTTEDESAHPAVFLPVGFERLELRQALVGDAWVWVRPSAQTPESDDERLCDLTFYTADSTVALCVEGFRIRRLALDRGTDTLSEDWLHHLRWQRHEATPPSEPREIPTTWWLAMPAGSPRDTLRQALEARALEVRWLDPQHLDDPETCQALWADAPGPRAVVHVPSTSPETVGMAQATETEAVRLLHLTQSLAKDPSAAQSELWLLSRGAQDVRGDEPGLGLEHAPLWGLGRVLQIEHPELSCRLVDLDGVEGDATEDCGASRQTLLEVLLEPDAEDQLAIRQGERWVPRMVRGRFARPGLATPGQGAPRDAATVPSFSLLSHEPGVLDHLTLTTTERPEPGPGEVLIEVRAGALNFIDVLKAMGAYPGMTLGEVLGFGNECAGVVRGVGEGVTSLAPGDRVMAVAYGSFGRHVVTPEEFVIQTPEGLGFEDAATLPIAYLTALFSLEWTGRIEAGERVLIHSASGGVGLAALAVARDAGAEVLVTAGSPEKRDYLRSLGVEVVMDSRSLEFVELVRQATDGYGVDLVLNSLVGDALVESLHLLAPHGRFLEIGKRDIYEDLDVGLFALRENRSISAIDLDRVFREKPKTVAKLMRTLVDRLEAGRYHALPKETFPIERSVEAFRHMAQAGHKGKIVITVPELHETSDVAAGFEVAPPLQVAQEVTLRDDRSYLISGGLGGLGLAVARWLVDGGARHLALMGRSAPSPEAAEVLTELEAQGAQITVLAADVADRDQLAQALDRLGAEAPPLAGIFHAAGVLDDGTLLELDRQRFHTVLAPKVWGAWNLHQLTADTDLDLFVLFSSAASLLGSPGQGNYCAANEFLDALAHHRRLQGQAALSINWGPWSEVGLAARPDRGERLSFRGIGSITPEQGVGFLERILTGFEPRMGVIPFDLEQWCQFYPRAARSPVLSELLRDVATGGESGGGELRAELEALGDPEAQRQALEDHLREQIGAVLRLPASRVDPTTALKSLGLDSLMSLELRNRLESSLGLSLSATLVWSHPTAAQLAEALLPELLGPTVATTAAAMSSTDSAPATEATATAAVTTTGATTAEPTLSDDEADELLDLLEGFEDDDAEELTNERTPMPV